MRGKLDVAFLRAEMKAPDLIYRRGCHQGATRSRSFRTITALPLEKSSIRSKLRARDYRRVGGSCAAGRYR